ncbi:MAG: hypothetical protein QME90_05525 [Thermodesulfobacteriota bacterium]|nr:hypothetical protein [Thermodesulfobacteriota bacterium]
MNLIILNSSAADYKKALESGFPDLTIYPATKEEGIGSFIEKAEILLTNRTPDGLIKKALKIQWIQVMTTGLDYMVNFSLR